LFLKLYSKEAFEDNISRVVWNMTGLGKTNNIKGMFFIMSEFNES